MSIPEKYIRQCVERGFIYYTQHAILRMGQRGIHHTLIENAIINGEVLEIQDFPDEDIKVVFHSVEDIHDPFYVIVAADYPQVAVITVCYFLDDVWDQLGTIRRRRGN